MDNYLTEWGDFAVGEPISSWADVHWSSDWNGDEVGYDDIDVVGLYTIPGTDIDMYINTENGIILEMWEVRDEE